MKHAVATIDRGERRDMPQTPWPLVQPDPYRVPMPTNTPAAISPSQPLLNSICGSAVNKPRIISAADALTVTIWLARDTREQAADPVAIRRRS